MIKKFNQEQFDNARSRDKLLVECEYCHKDFLAVKKEIQSVDSPNSHAQVKYCSISCRRLGIKTAKTLSCKTCNKTILRSPSAAAKSKNHFCSNSCSAKFHNKHKTTGCRVSKLEKWLQATLVSKYGGTEFLFNSSSTIQAELDIYIPSLKLAFELNGIFHYEPIFGEEKLSQTQNRDQAKFALCREAGISLCVLDTSSQKRFTEQSSDKFLQIITEIIDSKMAEIKGIQPLPPV